MSAIGFLIKKAISAALHPLGLAIALLVAGVVLWYRRPEGRRGQIVVIMAVLWLFVLSLPITGFILTRSLEMEAGDYVNPSELVSKGVEYVAVLGATIATDGLSPADTWQEEGILRLMEAIRIWQGLPNSKLILSGGSLPGRQSNAGAMAVLPIQLGVPRESLVLETQAADTIDEAHFFRNTVGMAKPFALVTSAVHMPRSMEIFRNLGMKPIACPCAFRTKLWPIWYSWFVPDLFALENSHRAIHEYLGRLWLSFRNKIPGWHKTPVFKS
jgi:uncharacterized SAM-binding protein YcdF (DUF218 family)